MAKKTEYRIRVYGNDDQLPSEAEQLFADELAGSRKPLPLDRADRHQWRFARVCAVTDKDRVLGGAHMDMGPVNFGPLGQDKLAYLERVLVRPEHRRQGIATAVLRKLIQVAKEKGCHYIRCNAKWDNPAELALYKKCGFALTDVNEDDGHQRYFTVKPLQGYGCGI